MDKSKVGIEVVVLIDNNNNNETIEQIEQIIFFTSRKKKKGKKTQKEWVFCLFVFSLGIEKNTERFFSAGNASISWEQHLSFWMERFYNIKICFFYRFPFHWAVSTIKVTFGKQSLNLF